MNSPKPLSLGFWISISLASVWLVATYFVSLSTEYLTPWAIVAHVVRVYLEFPLGWIPIFSYEIFGISMGEKGHWIVSGIPTGLNFLLLGYGSAYLRRKVRLMREYMAKEKKQKDET